MYYYVYVQQQQKNSTFIDNGMNLKPEAEYTTVKTINVPIGIPTRRRIK